MEARCQCGQIKFTTPTPAPRQIYVCHCTECRHQSSSAFGITASFPFFDIPAPFEGAIGYYSRTNSDGYTRGSFCTKCGSRLMHQHITAAGPPRPTVSVKGGCLDGLTKEMMKTVMHIWTRSAIVDIPEGAVSYEEEPPE